MQVADPIQPRELRYNQPKHPGSRDQPVPLLSDSNHGSSSAKNTIARSMSRYRGNRPANPPTSVPVPSLELSSTPKQSPLRDSPRKHAIPSRTTEEIDSHNKDGGASKQNTRATPSQDKTSEIRVQETGSRAVYSPKRGPDLYPSRGESRPTTRGSPARSQDHANVNNISRSRAHRRQNLSAEDDDGHRSSSSVTRHRRTERANVDKELVDHQHQYSLSQTQQKPEFERQKKNLASMSPTLALSRHFPLPKKSFTERMADHISKYQSAAKSDSKADLKKKISTPIAIGPGGDVAVPQFDAPISAVNAGERRVIVKSKDFIISLPVMPSTTPVDIIRSIAKQNPGSVDVNASVLVESFKQVGLERPLRMYEHIRDILNSWDTDTQNTLVLEPSPTRGNDDDDLDVRNVSNVQPGETSVYLYHSQKPGRWDKRCITLRPDGQLLIKKNGIESANICHLSDFDIYVPTPRQMTKKIKPPKKVCFAVKSQQKSSIFISTANFIHFFSTGDKKLATSWYKAVQEWRSWYLVNVMGKGQNVAQRVGDTHERDHRGSEFHSEKLATPGHRPNHTLESADYPAYAIAPHSLSHQMRPTQQPLRASSNQRPSTAKGPAESSGILSSIKPTRNRAAPPVSFPKYLMEDVSMGAAAIRAKGISQETSFDESGPQPFSTTGLLGRTYSQRQKTQNDQERNSGSRHGHNPTTHTATINGDSGGIKRTMSLRQKPKPLIDLTPVYQEPPQHTKKGKGVVPDQMPAGGLIDIATSPEVAIPIPPTKAWRRVAAGSGDGTQV